MSCVTTDPSAKLGQALAQWRGLHMAQVERRIEQEQQLVLEAIESIAVIVGVDGDREVLAHPPGKRLFGQRRENHRCFDLHVEPIEEDGGQGPAEGRHANLAAEVHLADALAQRVVARLPGRPLGGASLAGVDPPSRERQAQAIREIACSGVVDPPGVEAGPIEAGQGTPASRERARASGTRRGLR